MLSEGDTVFNQTTSPATAAVRVRRSCSSKNGTQDVQQLDHLGQQPGTNCSALVVPLTGKFSDLPAPSLVLNHTVSEVPAPSAARGADQRSDHVL